MRCITNILLNLTYTLGIIHLKINLSSNSNFSSFPTSWSKQSCLFFNEAALVNSSVKIDDQRPRPLKSFSVQTIWRNEDRSDDSVLVDRNPLDSGGHVQTLALAAGQQLTLVRPGFTASLKERKQIALNAKIDNIFFCVLCSFFNIVCMQWWKNNKSFKNKNRLFEMLNLN